MSQSSASSVHSIPSSVPQQSPSPPPSVPTAAAPLTASPKLIDQSLDLSAPSIHAIANARIYHTQLSAKKNGANGGGSTNEEWIYSRLKGTLKFGQNWTSTSTVDPYSKKQGNTGSQYYFALADDMTGRTIWMFQIPTTFLYEVERPFFHIFNGRTRKYGFLFEDDDEAALFSRKVINETCRDTALKRGRSVKPRGSPFRSRSLTASMISSPAPNSFRHVSHIGVSKGGAFEVSRTLDSAFKEGLLKLQNGLGNQIVVCESSEFLASFWRDVDSRSQSFDEGRTSEASKRHIPLTAASIGVAF